MCSIDLQKGGGRRDRKASISLTRLQALAPTQTDTNSASEFREEERVCGEKRQRKRSGHPRQTGKLHFHRCRFCVWGGRDDKEEGGVIIRALLARQWWGCSFFFFFPPAVSWLQKPGREEISQSEQQSLSCLVWPGTWADEIMLQRINLPPPPCQLSSRLHHLPRSRFTDLVVSRDFAARFQISSKKNPQL